MALLPDGVVHLDPAAAVFVAMVEGWETQRARFLKADTISARVALVRRLVEFSNQYPLSRLADVELVALI
ncbi:hypothetical protein [Plantactinospora sp. KLBMP9567]|uniref:hypothetical protein n=1 Tax=Plantactinospora sp. KLBMP9567 TaxID=3085900 RepID=UPI0029810382|nr:hypothetical protein [Plantactinospora sp. KLBMP9567]MDW5323830.1 hypothetical protein [Plantactinospora sp. KLBMP9567]